MNKDIIKWGATLGIVLAFVLATVLIRFGTDAAAAAQDTVPNGGTGGGIIRYTEEVTVDWTVLPGEEPIIIRHDDGSTWRVLPFAPQENAE